MWTPPQLAVIILNYIVAYQTIHRSAKAKAGDKVLIIGASGGVGMALLELGQIAGLKMYAIASKSKHQALEQYGAIPIDYHTEDYLEVIRKAEPQDWMRYLTAWSGGISKKVLIC